MVFPALVLLCAVCLLGMAFVSGALWRWLPIGASFVLASVAALLVPFLIWSRWEPVREKSVWLRLGLLRYLVAGGLAGAGLFLFGLSVVEPLSMRLFPVSPQQIESFNNTFQKIIIGSPSSVPTLLLRCACLALVPAVCEELFFRGLVLITALRSLQGARVPQGRSSWMPVVLACVFSAALFSLFHLSLSKSIPMLYLGLVFGAMVLYTCNVWVSVLAHLVNNILAVVLMHRGMESLPYRRPFVVTAAVVLLLVATGLLKKRGRREPTSFVSAQGVVCALDPPM